MKVEPDALALQLERTRLLKLVRHCVRTGTPLSPETLALVVAEWLEAQEATP
jgi:hypothetical protein